MSHKKLEEMKKGYAYEDLCDLKKDLIKIFAAELHSKGVNDLDTKDCGEVTDMIKDLAEAEKYCMEAWYYESVIKAMEKVDEEEELEGKMGYNAYRYSSGRYAPKGRGTRRGYIPEMAMNPYLRGYLYDPNFEDEMELGRMGYQGEGRGNSRGSSANEGRSQSGSRMGYDIEDDPRHGREYNEYKRAKRHYVETKSPEDKRMMDEHAMKHVNETIDSFREMWRDADPNMRKRMKADLTSLVGEMPT